MHTSSQRSSASRARVAALVVALIAALAPWAAQDATAQAGCPCSLWPSTATPAVASDSDTTAVELGVKLQASQNGYIKAIRFYKSSLNTGTHVGNLWTESGQKLATVTFTSETSSGWQQASFSSPVPVSAGTTYVASYHAPNGRYSIDANYFSSARTNGPLTAPASGAAGGNGVYRYGASGFPVSSWQASNYWVDVVFDTTAVDTAPPSVIGQTPAPDATGVAVGTNLTATFDEAIDSGSLSFELDGPGGVVPGQVSYDAAAKTATLDPDANLAASTTYTASVSASDIAEPGNAMSGPVTWSFSTAAPAGQCPCSLWTASTTPGTPAANDGSAVELGMRFRPSEDGFITGVRFYKGSGNTGTHVGNVWAASGALLGSVTFTGESASGWQEAALPAPVTVTAGTTYVVSYHAQNGRYAVDYDYFDQTVTRGPLTAPETASGNPNGVYRYGGSAFPTFTYRASNYWVDVVFDRDGEDTSAPTVVGRAPLPGATDVGVSTAVTATFNEPVDPTSIGFELRDGSDAVVASTTSYDEATSTAMLQPLQPLAHDQGHTARLTAAEDLNGNGLDGPVEWSFTTEEVPPPPLDEGPGGPVLAITAAGRPFSSYYTEILRAEGLNLFATADIGTVTPSLLAEHDVVVLGEMPVTSAQVTMLEDWVGAGGNLIAMRPSAALAGLLGLTPLSSTLSDAYLQVDTSSGPGVGIVGETIQFHGSADRYALAGATAIATLYSTAATATTNPAVAIRSVGTNGGQAAAFTYDLARSVVYTRQGNPAWDGQERDGLQARRSNDLYYGAASFDPQPDWIDLDKVEIPQADEQQRLLANMIRDMRADRGPLPSFWYFPDMHKAVFVATGDDHGNNGTEGRFDAYEASSPSGCSVVEWECLRFGSYIYPGTPLSHSAAAEATADGFEVGVHIRSHGSGSCLNYDEASLASDYTSQIAEWQQTYTSLPAPETNRTHCIVWSDWSSQASVAEAHGVRLDTNYYYWPSDWVNDRPGFFTGSGLPMRFAELDGTMVDVYQAVTQMTDESEQSYPHTPVTLIERAQGPEGFYGAFTANMHTDNEFTDEDGAFMGSALAAGVPTVTGRQLLDWTDARNRSSFTDLAWDGDELSFGIDAHGQAGGLTALMPTESPAGTLTSLSRDGTPVSFTTETIKGVHYAIFEAVTDAYVATYEPPAGAAVALAARSGPGETRGGTAPQDEIRVQGPPTISAVEARPRRDGSVVVTWQTDRAATSTVAYGVGSELNEKAVDGSSATVHEVVLERLSAKTTYTFRVSSSDNGGETVWPPAGSPAATFTTAANDTKAPVLSDITVTPMPGGTAMVTWTSDEAGDSGVRFGTSRDTARTRYDGEVDRSHEVMLTHLEPLTTYYYRVGTRDPAGNLGFSPIASFTTPLRGVDDTTVPDLRMGTRSSGAYLAEEVFGGMSLAPEAADEFAEGRVSAGWTQASEASGGVVRVVKGGLTLDGGRAQTKRTFGPGRAVEGKLTFSGTTPQAVGFGTSKLSAPSLSFNLRDGVLYATTTGKTRMDTAIRGDWLDEPHRYRIEWSSTKAVYRIDGEVVASHKVTVPGLLPLTAVDLRTGGGELVIDWVRMARYATTATYTSRVMDAGAFVTWQQAQWDADVPAGTTLRVSVRTGSMARPDATWTPFRVLEGSGAPLGEASRYIQYRVELATSSANVTPVLQRIGFTHDGAALHDDEL